MDSAKHRLLEGIAKRSQQTGTAQNQSDMQHQVAGDGGASATDGYSPAGEVPPPATRLLDLPPALLDDIACRVMQLGARNLLHLTCRAFALAPLLHVPALSIHLGRQRCDQLLTPRVAAALQARTSKLTVTLELPQREYTQDYTDQLANALAKLDNCAAVEACKLVSSWLSIRRKRKHLHCTPGLAQHLLDSFPRLTALTLQGLSVSSNELASMLSHPPLALQLQQLDLTDIIVLTDTKVPDGEEPRAWGTLFQGLRLKQLTMVAVELPPLPSFQLLAQHLTQLHLMYHAYDPYNDEGVRILVQYLQPLAQLQVLTLPRQQQLEGLAELLQALPQLHTLQLPAAIVRGQQQLDTLLTATQLTSIQLRGVCGLNGSRADAPCSWQRLELTGDIQGPDIPAQYLPLHSLAQPLVLGKLYISVDLIPNPEVAVALHLVSQACKVPVQNKEVQLTMLSQEQTDPSLISPTLLQQQRVDLAQLVALLQPLQCCGKVVVRGLDEVTAADVLALAPLCGDCTHFELEGGSVKPSLEFWHQLVQLMPAVQQVEFIYVEGCVSAAMHESLQLMAEQPWARWLDITFVNHFTASKPLACWQAGSWLKTGIFKVTV
ncbi:hypothetical protein QJQ45_014612 [Haematococcus lacustris]|nr:hypothetical protein QJQ45_014612 [Haematococcus lacustris]